MAGVGCLRTRLLVWRELWVSPASARAGCYALVIPAAELGQIGFTKGNSINPVGGRLCFEQRSEERHSKASPANVTWCQLLLPSWSPTVYK